MHSWNGEIIRYSTKNYSGGRQEGQGVGSLWCMQQVACLQAHSWEMNATQGVVGVCRLLTDGCARRHEGEGQRSVAQKAMMHCWASRALI